jgi:hypothetical protein
MGRSFAALVLLSGCLPSSFFGSTGREHTPVTAGDLDYELEEPVEFYAWVPPESESLIYANFDAIRRAPEMHEAAEYFERWVTGPRRDVSRLFGASDCSLFRDSRRVLLASPVGSWTWVFTVDYVTDDALLSRRLDEIAPGPARDEGALSVTLLPGWEEPPLVAHPRRRTLVIATPDVIATAGANPPVLVDFVRAGDLAAWRSTGGIDSLDGLRDATSIEAHLAADDDETAPLRIAMIGHYYDANSAEAARAALESKLASWRSHSMARMLGFDDTLARARIANDGTDLHVELRLTPTQAAVIADVALSSMSLPEGM